MRNIEAKDITSRLASRADAVAAYLLPSGNLDGNEWRSGDVSGAPGQSLGIHIAGDKAGVWQDFATGEGGDLLDLWQAVRGVDFKQALQEAADYLGMDTTPDRPKPKAKPVPVRTSPPDGVDGVSRFTYTDADKQPVIYVTRQDAPDGKCIRQHGRSADGKGWVSSLKHAPNPRPLYRLPAILKGGGTVCVHEGEKAAVAACKARLLGIHTTTIGGAGNAKHSDFSPLNGRDVCIIPDNDEPGEKHAQQVAKLATDAGAKSVKIIRLPDLPAKGDIVEWLADGGTDEQWQKLIAKKAPETENKPNESMDETVDRLAKLSLLDYDTERQDEAKALGVRASTLDAEVKAARKEAHSDDDIFPEVEPWPDTVDGGALLDEIAAKFSRYVILPKHADTVAALWALNTYVHDASYHSPMIILTSPEKRCGKTTALTVFMALCNKPLPAANVSGAVVFRAIEQWHPTLLIDEVDSFLADKDDLRGVINSGHTKASAYVLRCDGDNNEPKRFSTWCPKILSGIGRISDTLEDRSILFPLRRKLSDEKVARLRIDRGGFDEIKQKCIRWGEDNCSKIAASDPVTLDGLNDRAADNWTPLFAIADLCGWREKAEAAALSLSGDADNSDSANVMLLADVQKVFEARGVDKLPSQSICDDLVKMEDRPWPEWCKGRPITPRQIAKRLGGFNIHTRQTYQSGRNNRCYDIEDFKDAFARYCVSKCYAAKSEGTQQKTDFPKCYENENLADRNSQNLKQDNTLSTIADRSASAANRVNVSL